MEKFIKLTSSAVPLMRHNVDTDAIISIDRLMESSRADMGAFAFEVWRFLPDGSENPEFELNRPGFGDAQVMIGGRNFGCGSSREMAVWALAGMGYRCVIASSFGDIFANNCVKNGLLAITLDEDIVERFAATATQVAGTETFTIDLETCTITAPDGESVDFEIGAGDRDALLAGLDEIGKTLKLGADIATYQSEDRARRPWIYGVSAK
jgi:3-isopropylmalate/(R)-2-methylmalate dehydratase small subunit